MALTNKEKIENFRIKLCVEFDETVRDMIATKQEPKHIVQNVQWLASFNTNALKNFKESL